MEQSKIYDLLENGRLHKWREDIEKSESESWFYTRERETYKELEKELNEQGKKLLKLYSLAAINKLDYFYYNLNIKILNFGIKIGQELQKAFLKDEEH